VTTQAAALANTFAVEGAKQATYSASMIWLEPEPLHEALPDVAQFDLELIPESLRLLVRDVSERMQVPMDFPAVAAIATLAGVTCRRALIQPKQEDDSWTVVPNLWGGIVAPPGMLKSPTISCMTQPVCAIEKELRDAYANEEKAYKAAMELHELDVNAWKQQCTAASKKGEAKPAKPELAQTPPTLRRLLTSDATFESLHAVLAENPAGIFVLRDELTGWLAGLERQGREQERAFYLEAWNGNSAFTIDRIGRGNIYVPHACIALFGGIQPSRMRQYLADALKGGPSNDGLIQRFQLLVWPDAPKDWKYIDRRPNEVALKHAATVYRRIAAMDATNLLKLKFDPDAQALFEEWLTDLEHRLHGDDLHPAMSAHLSKYRSLMPALALLFTLADGWTDCVPVAEAQLAADLCGYLETHAARVYACQVRPEHNAAIALSRRLATGWRREEGVFTVRDVYRNGWEMLDAPDRARAALMVLTEYNWIREEPADNSGPGRPTETYRINPKIGGAHAGE
jgi:putative DNA primase/helicase